MDLQANQTSVATSTSTSTPFISQYVSTFFWFLFFSTLGAIVFYQINAPQWNAGDVLRINSFTLLIWLTVTFFSAIVSTYAKNYLRGFTYHQRFSLLSIGFTFSVMLFVVSNHVALFLLAWLCMGIFMSQLIGVKLNWKEANHASKLAQTSFLMGSLFLSIGMGILCFYSQAYTLSGIFAATEQIPSYILLLASLFIIVAAIIQSAIYPFHRWLLSAMTAPTPASALMHAGFVNGAGILLTMLSTICIASNSLTLLFFLGGITAIIAQFAKLLQPNVKQKLACSTIAQMGFMIMQCGLGFFNAAVAHLILHGFYKAYLFLSSGEEIGLHAPQKAEKINIKPLQALVVILFGAAGAILFALLTGKTSAIDSSVFLTLIVAITVGQATYNLVKEPSLTVVQKTGIPIVFFIAGIGAYALFYNGVTALMHEMPLVEVPQPLSILQIVFGVTFLIGFFVMKLGVYKKVPWLYVKLLNLTQPHKTTIFSSKN